MWTWPRSWAAGDTDAAPWACVDLEAPYALRRVVLFPHPAPYGEGFPRQLHGWRSRRTGESWINAPRGRRRGGMPEQPVVIELSEQPLVGPLCACIRRPRAEALKLAELAVFGEVPGGPRRAGPHRAGAGAGRYRPAQGHAGQRQRAAPHPKGSGPPATNRVVAVDAERQAHGRGRGGSGHHRLQPRIRP